MIQNIHCDPQTIHGFTTVPVRFSDRESPFPLISIDKDSYIVSLEIQSGINFDLPGNAHCVHIGKYCALADHITFLVNLNHDYPSLIQGSVSFMNGIEVKRRLRIKGSVFVENDVWIGHGATVLSGVTIHNGAVVAAESVVTKDVPPFAIVGGNPARVIGYRFEEQERKDLLEIAWWNWDDRKLRQYRADFMLPVGKFIEKYIEDAHRDWQEIVPYTKKAERPLVLFIPDFHDPYPLWKKVLKEYFAISRPDMELFIYILPEDVKRGAVEVLMETFSQYEDQEAYVTIQEGGVEDARCYFSAADYFVTTRAAQTIQWIGYAMRYDVKILYGTDIPVFGE